MSLYSAATTLIQIEEYLIASEGVITPEVDELLTVTQENFKSEILNLVHIIKEAEGDILYYQAEVNRINDKIKRKEELISRIKNIIRDNVIRFGEIDNNPKLKNPIYRFSAGTFNLSTRTNEYINILDEDKIPDEYKKVTISDLNIEEATIVADTLGKMLKMDKTVSKTKIKESLNNGISVPGAEKDSNITLNIK